MGREQIERRLRPGSTDDDLGQVDTAPAQHDHQGQGGGELTQPSGVALDGEVRRADVHGIPDLAAVHPRLGSSGRVSGQEAVDAIFSAPAAGELELPKGLTLPTLGLVREALASQAAASSASALRDSRSTRAPFRPGRPSPLGSRSLSEDG